MTSVRESFVNRFGEEQAENVEAAAQMHRNGINDTRFGTDSFKWAFLICIGYECISRNEFREYHQITAPLADLKDWALKAGALSAHDGDFDYLSLFCGEYNDWVVKEPEEVPCK